MSKRSEARKPAADASASNSPGPNRCSYVNSDWLELIAIITSPFSGRQSEPLTVAANRVKRINAGCDGASVM